MDSKHIKWGIGEGLGANIVDNPTFDLDEDWSKTTGWTITGGELVATSVPAWGGVTQSNGLFDIGETYKITYTITIYTSGSVEFFFDGGGTGNGANRSSAGTFTEYLIPESDGTYLGFSALGSGFTGKIDNVFVQLVL